jgi:beta-mannanase
MRELEASVDREFDLIYRFYDWDATIPDAYQMRAAQEGRMLRVNVTSRDDSTGLFTRWADIASGAADAQIRLHAQNLKRVPGPVYFSFQQEPEKLVGIYGTVYDFANAWKRMHTIFAQEGADNVVWTWTVSGSSSRFEMYTGGLYPGDAYVDWVSYDPYNFYACHGAPWETFDQSIASFYDFAMANGFGDKPFMLSEYGSTPDPYDVNRRATWFEQSVEAIRARSNIKAVIYFNSSASGPLGECDVRVTSDAPSMEAFREMGLDGMFRQPKPASYRP